MTAAEGTPEMVGALLPGDGVSVRPFTRILKGPMERVSRPSVTVMVISSESPTCASSGVPLSKPVSSLKVAQAG
jgi:hypothetical protein